MKMINFTKTELNKLPIPEKGFVTYKDSGEKGLSLYVTSAGAKTFFVRKRINGRDERIVIGQYPDKTIAEARGDALDIKRKIAKGINPNEEKQKLRSEITFGELFVEYMERYSKKHKRSWKYDEREINKFLSHWFSRKISTLSKYEIAKLHDKIHDDNGLYQANRILERIRAMFNKAIEWGWDGANPTNGIKKFKEQSRDRFISPAELPRFIEALNAEHNETARDYFWISLLTGARKSNVLAMCWDDIDWERRVWRIPMTKNGESVLVPLVGEAIEVLQKRQKESDSDFVFPGDSASGHLTDPKKAWKRILKAAEIDDLRIHDIRRTLGSYQAITGASLQVIGKTLGHKSQDATQVYSRLSDDPVRDAMEKATKRILYGE